MKLLIEGEANFWQQFDFDSVQNHFHDGGFKRLSNEVQGQLQSLTSFWSRQLNSLPDEKDFPSVESSFVGELIPPWSRSAVARLGFAEEQEGRSENSILILVGYIWEHASRKRQVNNQQAQEGAFFGAASSLYATASALGAGTSVSNQSEAAEAVSQLARQKLSDLAQEIDALRDLRETSSIDFKEMLVKADSRNKAVVEKYGRGLIEHKNNSVEQEKRRQEEFEKLKAAFNAHLRISAPVKLWENLENRYTEASDTAWITFKLGGIAFVIAAAALVFGLGDAIAPAFVPTTCIEGSEPSCSRISAKGPLAISAIIAVSTVWLWFLRLQMKIHLSERHLLLDARERRAFAETYLALVKGGEVTTEHEAVVLQSLFRPPQDGIIKDDGGIDVGVAGLLSRALSKNS